MALLVVVLAAAAVNVLAGLALARLRRGRARNAGMAGLVALDAVLAVLLCLEIGFALFHAQSDGFNITMSSRKWFERHWRPVNSLGYRDLEPPADPGGRQVVMVLGDSFAAGHGVDAVADRFSDLLSKSLGPSRLVVNVAKIGWDTSDELKALREFPLRPDVVVLAYYVNDIYGAAGRSGFELPFGVRFPPPGPVRYVVDHSALFNFVYWRLARVGGVEDAEKSFWGRLKAAYADEAVFADHAAELRALAGYCRERGIRLVILLLPNLLDVSGSAPLTARVGEAFRALGVETLDMSPLLAGRSPGSLVVNAVDAHANVSLHAEMADIVGKALAERP